MKFEISDIKLAATDAETKQRVRDAEVRKKDEEETLEEAWQRIRESKKYTAGGRDKERLDDVYNAMMQGEIGREPVEPGKKQKKFSAAEAMRLWAELNERKKEQRIQELIDSKPDNYELVLTEDHLADMMNAARHEEIVSIDTETTGVDVYTDVIVGLSLTLPKADRHFYVPVAHKDPTPQLDRDFVLRKMYPLLYSERVKKVAHNAIFDIAMFRRHGSDLKGVVWDTMTAMHLLNENEPSFKLKDLAPKYLRVEADVYGELFGKVGADEIPIDIATVYAAKDTHLTYKLYEFQLEHFQRLPTILKYYEEIEVPLLYVIVALEANGYLLDLDYAKTYGEQLKKRGAELEAELTALFADVHEGDEPINLNSPAQVTPAMSALIGRKLPNLDAKKTLKPLKDKFEVVAKYLEYKNVTKLAGTYIEALPLKQNPTTGKWHSRYNPMGTVTGRFSSGKDEADTTGQGFNIQNQSPEARTMFVPKPGRVLVGADFKAQEIRCVAYLSGEPVLIEAFRTNRDPYAMMASTFYNRPYEEVNKNPDGSDTKERKEMKVVWLATLYGMSDFSLADMLKVDKDEATKFKTELFESMPKLSQWLKDNEDFVKSKGYVWADKEARKRRLPDARLQRKQIPWGKYFDPAYEEERKHNSRINRAIRQATNARVQGSSSIQTKVTMIKAHEACEQREGWALWGSIHDELIFEVPVDITREDIEVIRNLMLHSYPWGDEVENGTDIEIMTRWGEGLTVDEWFKQKEETE